MGDINLDLEDVRRALIHLIDCHILLTNKVIVTEEGELLQSNGDSIGWF